MTTMNPVETLRQPFKLKAPGAINNNATVYDIEQDDDETAGGAEASTSTSSPFVMNMAGSLQTSKSLAHAVKRAKNNVGAAIVYRDGDTTGYEDDGSETPDWISIHKPPSGIQHKLADQTNNHHQFSSPAAFSSMRPLGLKAREGSGGVASSSSSRAPVPCSRYFMCMWRKPQQKKHKTWDGDGVLVVSGGKATLYDQSNNQTIGSGRLPRDPELLIDETCSLGGKEIEIEREIPSSEFLKGNVFGSRPLPQAAPSRSTAAVPASRPAPAVSTPSTLGSSSFYGGAKKSGASSFYGGGSSNNTGGLVKKFTTPAVTRQPAYGDTQVGNPPPTKVPASSYYGNNNNNSNSFYKKKNAKEDLSDLEGPDTRLLAGMNSFPSRANFANVGSSARTLHATNGLGAPPKEPKPLFDPKKEGALVMKRLDPALEKLLNKKGLPIVDVVLDPMLTMRLRDHQKEGVKFLYECVMGMRSEGHGCILADEMGLGKTAQAVALIWTLLKQTPFFGGGPIIDQAVIVCPVTLVKNWKKECYKWLGKDRIKVFTAESKQSVTSFVQGSRHWQILIIGYERLRTVVDVLKKARIGLMICDEGHRLKSAGAKTTKALRELETERRVILSGTPIQNELSEFHAMVDFVNPGILDSYSSFKKIFEFPIMKSRQPNCTKDERELGQYRAESLTEATAPFILRRTSEIIAGFLPAKSEYVVFIAPTPIQMKLYQHVLESKAVESILHSSGKTALTLIDLLKKICNSPSLLLRAEEMEKANAELVRGARQLMPANAHSMGPALSGKMKALRSMLKLLRDESDEKIVVVSNFTQTLNLIQALCERERFGYCRLDGSTKPEDRQRLVDNFNKTCQDSNFVFMLSTKAGGTGLNIVGASRLVLFDSDWNPANDLQAMGRIHRDGQKKPCHIYRFITTGTIDEKIFQRQITKMGLADSVMREGTAKGGKDSDAFTNQQLRAIFTMNNNTSCETHDQLDCDCTTGSGLSTSGSVTPQEVLPAEAETANNSDSEDELPDVEQSFVTASQYKPKVDLRKNLAVLKEWTHVNCQTTDETRADDVEDNVLRDMVMQSMASMKLTTTKKPSSSRAVIPEDEDESEEEDISEEALIPVTKPQYEGGEITFVFLKKKGVLDQEDETDTTEDTTMA